MITLRQLYTLLFFIGLFFIPFNEFEGLSFLGEYKNEAATYFFLSAFLLVLTDNLLEKRLYFPLGNRLVHILFLFLLCTVLSTLINYETVVQNYYKQTSGVSRYLRQTISLLLSSLVFTYTFWNVFRGISLRSLFLKIRTVLLYSLLFVFVYGCIEIMIVFYGQSRLLPVLHLFDYFPFVNTNIFSNRKGISSVTYEIPSLGNYLITIAGFMFSYIITSTKKRRFIPTFMVLMLMFYSDSRTALVLVSLQFVVFGLVLLHHLEYRKNILAFVKLSALGIVLLLVFNSKAVISKVEERVDRLNFAKNLTTDVSNKSRFGMQEASLNVFKDHPVWGVGLGQDTYHKIKYYPYWSTQNNYEFKYFYKNQRDPSFPSAYNLYTRLLSELGLVGVSVFVLLIAMCFFSAVKLWKYSVAEDQFMPIILMVCFFGLAVNWMQTDFFRQYGFWLCLMLLIKAQSELRLIDRSEI